VFPDKSGLRLHFSKKIDSLRLYRFPASAIMEPGLFAFRHQLCPTGINRNPLSLQNRVEFVVLRPRRSRRPPAFWATQGAQYASRPNRMSKEIPKNFEILFALPQLKAFA
jgi:hypothetical protein